MLIAALVFLFLWPILYTFAHERYQTAKATKGINQIVAPWDSIAGKAAGEVHLVAGEIKAEEQKVVVAVEGEVKKAEGAL